MAFIVPSHTPYQWSNAPSTATPLDKAHLEAAETDLVNYTQQAVKAYDSYLKQYQYTQPWLGLNSNSLAGYGSLSFWPQRGVVWDRQEITAPAAVPTTNITTALNNGMRIVFPIEDATYGTSSPLPTGSAITTYASYFVSTVQAIESAFPNGEFLYEIINESWNFHTGTTAAGYADIVVAVLNAANTAGLDLTRIYPMVKDQSWPAAMIAQQSSLATLIQGWSVHPYGSAPPGYAQNTTQGIASLPYFRQQLTCGQNNILVSEIGVWTPDVNSGASGGPTSESSARNSNQAQAWTTAIINEAAKYRQAGWLRAMLFYNRNDGGWATNLSGGALTGVGTALAQGPGPESPNPQYFAKPATVYSYVDDGYVASTMDPAAAPTGVSLTSGVIYFFRVRVDRRSFYQNIVTYVDTSGVTLTANQCLAGLYADSGSVAGSTTLSLQWDITGNQATNWQSTGRKSMSVGGDNVMEGYWYIAILANGSTPPKFRGSSPVDQVNTGGFPARAMRTASSANTSLPANIDLTNGSTVNSFGSVIWAALA